ncbi:MAG: ABC transporter substrate-binding protein [Planctomycetota bacterium]
MAAAGVGIAFAPLGQRKAPPGRLVISYWEKWSSHEGAAMRRIVDRFNASQDRIWVEYLNVSMIDTKAMLAISGNDAPALVGLWSFIVPEFADTGAFLQLDDLAAGSEIGEGLYAPAVWELLNHRGKLWAGIGTASSILMYYNRAAFREVGLDADRPPRTIEELTEYEERLTIRDAQGKLQRLGFLPNEPVWWPAQWPEYFGGSLYSEATDTITASTPENVAAYEWFQSYLHRFGPSDVRGFAASFGTYQSPQMSLLAGQLAMIVQGPWLGNVIAAYKPELDYAATPMPVPESIYDPDNPRALIECDVLMIPSNCPEPEAAWEFLKFTQRRDQQYELATAHYKSSPFRETDAAFQAAHPNKAIKEHDRVFQSSNAFWLPRMSSVRFYREEIRKARDRIWADETLDPSLALETVQSRASAEYARVRARYQRQLRARTERERG